MSEQWISVKDRLPTTREPIWVSSSGWGCARFWALGSYSPENFTTYGVTHWMPATLPEPPKSDSEIALDAAWSAIVGLNLYSQSERFAFKTAFLAGWQAHKNQGEGPKHL